MLKDKKGFICDMDGVIYHGNKLLPGVVEFVNWLKENNKHFLFLTNNSGKTRLQLQTKLRKMGLEVEEENFYTAALATAKFLKSQGAKTAYVIGDFALAGALSDEGIAFDQDNPEYVVIGETMDYNYDKIKKATLLVNNGAKLIGTNTDITAPTEEGIIPACRALVAPVECATGKKAYFVGKPNPLMMRTAVEIFHKYGIHSKDVAMVGDRMDTDIIAAIESGLDSVLVLTGVTSEKTLEEFPYRPKFVYANVGEIIK